MERHSHLDLAPEVRAALLAISAATIDRTLQPQRRRVGPGPRRRRTSSALRRSIPRRRTRSGAHSVQLVAISVSYRRFEGMAMARELARLHATTRLFVNAFQPSFKLREGARVRKRYHTPLTPCDRLIADPRTSEIVRERVQALRADLDPVRLLADMRAGQQVLVTLTDCLAATATPMPQPPIAAFLAGLHTAWRAGEVRPTAQAKPKPRRGRRRPDPLAAVTDEQRAWFEADPSRSGRDLLVRLQAAYPGRYPGPCSGG